MRRLGVLALFGVLTVLFVCFSLAPSPTRGGDDRPKPSKPAAKAAAKANSVKPADANSDRPEIALLRLLATHPVTAPYVFMTSLKNQRVVLRGHVGTKVVHDVAVRIAIESNIPFEDELVIDTSERSAWP